MSGTLKKNVESATLRQRRKEATYERIRARLYYELRSLMAEKKFMMAELAARLGFTETETRQQLSEHDLRLGQLVDILDVLNLEPYIVFRARRGWVAQ